MRDARDAIVVRDLEGRIRAWNQGAVSLYGWSEAEALAKVRQLSQAEVLEPYRTQRIAKGDRAIEVSLTSTALVNEVGQTYAIATTERPVASQAG